MYYSNSLSIVLIWLGVFLVFSYIVLYIFWIQEFYETNNSKIFSPPLKGIFFFNVLNSILGGKELFFFFQLILLKFNVSIFLYFAYVVTAIFAQVPSGELITG